MKRHLLSTRPAAAAAAAAAAAVVTLLPVTHAVKVSMQIEPCVFLCIKRLNFDAIKETSSALPLVASRLGHNSDDKHTQAKLH